MSNTCVSISVPLQTVGDDFPLTDSSDVGCGVRSQAVRRVIGLRVGDFMRRGRSVGRSVGHSRGKEEASRSVSVFTFFSALSLLFESKKQDCWRRR